MEGEREVDPDARYFTPWKVVPHSELMRLVNRIAAGLAHYASALGLWLSQANAATYEELMRKPAGVGDVAVMVVSMAILFAPMWFGMLKATRRLGWSQGWRNAAMMCLAPMAFVMLRIIIDTAHDVTSHNLWPFEIVLQAAVVLLLFAGLAFVRFAVRR